MGDRGRGNRGRTQSSRLKSRPHGPPSVSRNRFPWATSPRRLVVPCPSASPGKPDRPPRAQPDRRPELSRTRPRLKRAGFPHSTGKAGRMSTPHTTSKRSVRSKLDPASQFPIWISIDSTIGAADCARAHRAERPQAVTPASCGNSRGKACAAHQAPTTGRTNEPHLLTYTSHWATPREGAAEPLPSLPITSTLTHQAPRCTDFSRSDKLV